MITVDIAVSWNAQKRSQWATFRDELKAYLAKILAIYRLAPPDKKAELRAHNWLLSDLLDIIGE